MLTVGGAWASSEGYVTESDLLDASSWDADYAALLGLEGVGRQIMERMTLFRDGDVTEPTFLDKHTMGISENYTASYSNDAYYTLDTGFVGNIDHSTPDMKELTITVLTLWCRRYL